MKRFVLDASVALAWFIDRSIDPHAIRVRQLLIGGSRAVVPSLWQFEVLNGIVMAGRRGVLKPAEVDEMLEHLEVVIGQSIETSHEVSKRRIIATARDFHLTAYDAAYLELSKELQLPLATLDRALIHAAQRAGVPLVR